MGTVTVKGVATASVRPDRAVLSVTVTEVDRDPASALDRTVIRSKAVEVLLRELGLEETQWTTSGVSVTEQYEWRQERNELVGHRATASLQVSVDDLSQIGPILRRAVGEANAQVAGPVWRVDEDNPAVLALLGAAAVDARRRAEAYAATLGLRLGEVEAISEQPFGDDRPSSRPEAMMARGMAKADIGSEMPVNPGELELGVDVHVRFSLIPGR